jgi:hypothetical protein
MSQSPHILRVLRCYHGQKPYSCWPLEQGYQKGLIENKFVESYTSQCKSIHGKNHLQSYDFAGYALLW